MDARSTIIYYTSNREEERFERVIREQIVRASSLPIISVSQKPIDFGENICVGEVGISNQNAHRQFQVGCKAAKTEFVHAAEADTLYPPEYFDYFPPVNDQPYRCPIWLYRWGDDYFYKKPSSESATVIGREYVIGRLEKNLAGRGEGMWNPELEHGSAVPYTFGRSSNLNIFELSQPIVNIKTANGMHRWHGVVEKVKELPYWGTPRDIMSLFL